MHVNARYVNWDLCWCTCVMYFEWWLTPFVCWSAQMLWASFCIRFVTIWTLRNLQDTCRCPQGLSLVCRLLLLTECLSAQNMESIPSPPVMTLDPNDENIILEIPKDVDPTEESAEPTSKKEKVKTGNLTVLVEGVGEHARNVLLWGSGMMGQPHCAGGGGWGGERACP